MLRVWRYPEGTVTTLTTSASHDFRPGDAIFVNGVLHGVVRTIDGHTVEVKRKNWAQRVAYRVQERLRKVWGRVQFWLFPF